MRSRVAVIWLGALMLMGTAVNLRLWTIDYSITSGEAQLLRRQFDLASREAMDESAEWRKRYDEEADKAHTCSSELAKVTTVRVSNVSLGASERDIKEFFSFSGYVEYVEMQSDTERSQIAFVTFKDSPGTEAAVLLSGATIVDMYVNISLEPGYQLPAAAFAPPVNPETKSAGGLQAIFRKAEDVVSSMLAKGFILGKDAVNKAKSFDEKHQLTSTASAKVASLDKKIGLTEKISIGTSIVNEKVKEVDQKLQVSEKAKSALATAEQKVSGAGSTVMKNRYILTGTSWVTNAFNKVTKTAEEVGQQTKDKVGKVEDEERRKMVDDFAKVHLSESPKESELGEQKLSKPEPAQGSTP